MSIIFKFGFTSSARRQNAYRWSLFRHVARGQTGRNCRIDATAALSIRTALFDCTQGNNSKVSCTALNCAHTTGTANEASVTLAPFCGCSFDKNAGNTPYGFNSMPSCPTSNENSQKQAAVTKALANSVGQKPIRGSNVGNIKNIGSVGTTYQNVYQA